MHTIRLRHPWQLTTANPDKLQVLTYIRKFNLPSGLDNCRVLLAISAMESKCVIQRVSINDQSLSDALEKQKTNTAHSQNFVTDITEALMPFNQLQVSLQQLSPQTAARTAATVETAVRFDELAEAELRIVESSRLR